MISTRYVEIRYRRGYIRVGSTITAREFYGGAWRSAASASDGELCALHVELRLVRSVDGESLETDHIVSVRRRSRDS